MADDDDSHEQSRQEMANIRANPDKRNMALQLRGTPPQVELPNAALRARGTGARDVPEGPPGASATLRARGTGGELPEAPEPSEAPVAHAKGGSVHRADTKPRVKGGRDYR